MFFFFFSSRRRHTRCSRDWSSDVCSSDLVFEDKVRPSLDRCFAGEDVSYAEWFATALGRRHMAISYSPLRPDSERVEAVLVIGRDLTEHMLASEALHRSEEHTSELQSRLHLVCRLLLEKKNKQRQ